MTYFLPFLTVTLPLSFRVFVIPSRVASCERFGTVTEFLIFSKSELLILPILLTATGVVPAVGVYFSFWALTSTLNWTVVVFAGVDLSETVTVATFASTVAVLSTFPVVALVNGAASVALSLVRLLVSGVNPVGKFVIVKFWTFPVLSEDFTVIVAFSPRYTVTFGKLASGVDSESVTSPLSLTSFTVGLTVSLTFTFTSITLYGFTWVAAAESGPASLVFGNVTFT